MTRATPSPKAETRRVLTFAAVGLTGTTVYVLTALLSFQGLGWTALRANLAAFCTGWVVSYAGNQRLTFDSAADPRQSGPRYLVVSLISLALNQGIVFALTGPAAQPYPLALAVVCVVIPVVTYTLSRTWAFRPVGE